MKVDAIPMIHACVRGQASKHPDDHDGTNWTHRREYGAASYDLWPGAYLDPGDGAAIHNQCLLKIMIDGFPEPGAQTRPLPPPETTDVQVQRGFPLTQVSR